MTASERTSVALVMMPFGPTDRPSLGLSLLQQNLAAADIPARVFYPNLDFERRVGSRAYFEISIRLASAVAAEWLFSRVLAPVGGIDDYAASVSRRFLNGVVPEGSHLASMLASLPSLVGEAEALVERWSDAIIETGARVVGLSSCYGQHVACLALSERIKSKKPEIITVLGGTNCNDPMGEETFRRFQFLDAVVVGPGEIAFTALVRRCLAGAPAAGIPGVYWRPRDGSAPANPPADYALEPDLNSQPLPRFDDFFAAWEARRRDWPDEASLPDNAVVPIETSRGCWWGQKHHCVFCSENARSMHYRAKTPDRVFSEFKWLIEKYPGRNINATDEILDLKLIDAVMPRLAELPGRREIFFCLKANIRKGQLAKLAAAGVTALQPGIESLADEILKPMQKGVTGLQNIQLLKWCRELGISANWTIICGFPFERARSYERMTALTPLLAHLEPPRLLSGLILQRYSPLFTQPERFGIRNIRPNDSYRLIYGDNAQNLQRLAYHFEFDCDREKPVASYAAALQAAIADWNSGAADAFLVHHDEDGRVVIGDTRPMARKRLHHLVGAARIAYLHCDQVRSLANIRRNLAEHECAIDEVALSDILDRLVQDGLMMTENGLYLSLSARFGLRCLPSPALIADMLSAHASGGAVRPADNPSGVSGP